MNSEMFKAQEPYANLPEGYGRVGSRKNGGDGFNQQIEVGKMGRLISSMVFGGADADEIERAIRHSRIVIDAEKHQLNWRQSAIDNGIQDLMNKYYKKETMK